MEKNNVIFLLLLLVILGVAGFFFTQKPSTASSEEYALSDISVNQEESTQTEGGDHMTYNEPPEMVIEPGIAYSATLKTNLGDIVIDLTADETPTTVNNFVFLAREGFYDGVIFHRVIKGFMIQGGDPTGTGRGGPGYSFEDEIDNTQEFDGPGVLAMANSGPDTNGSQFFITHDATPWLNGAHTIFGRVTEGMDVVDKIANVKTGPQDKPLEDVIIETVEISEN